MVLDDCLDKVVKSFLNPENSVVMEEVYKLIVLNEQGITPFNEHIFWVQDPHVEKNSGVYWVKNNNLYCYDNVEGCGRKVNIFVPEDWTEIIFEEYNYKGDFLN